MEEVGNEPLITVTKFINFMDNNPRWCFEGISEDAVLDWFGLTVKGRDSIVRFLSMKFSRIHHKINNITRIPPIKHRLLKYFTNDAVNLREKSIMEYSQKGCKEEMGTPENETHPNVEDLLRAPHRSKRYQNVTSVKSLKFLEARGKLKLEHVDEGYESKLMRRIVLAYSDQIHLIVYEAQYVTRKRLF